MRQTINFRNLATPTVFALPFGKIAKGEQCLPHRAILASTPVRSRVKAGAPGVVVTLPADQQPGPGRGFTPVYGVAGLEPYANSGFPPRVQAKDRGLSGRSPAPPRPLVIGAGGRGLGRLAGEEGWFQRDFVKPFMNLADTRPWLMALLAISGTLVVLSVSNNAGKLVASTGK